MACGCGNRNKSAVTASGQPGTFRVIVSGRQVYETTNPDAAKTVAARFENADILEPGQS